MLAHQNWELEAFLRAYPLMKVRPSEQMFCLAGKFDFSAEHSIKGSVSDSFRLQILIPKNFPQSLPLVRETEGRIPGPGHSEQEKFHVNPDGTFCLGAPLRLKLAISKNPTLCQFAEQCIVPYLFAVSRKLETGLDFAFGELPHGVDGIMVDYKNILELESEEGVRSALKLLGMKKRIANKYPCPCNCGKRLGRCSFRSALNDLRQVIGRSSFRSEIETYGLE